MELDPRVADEIAREQLKPMIMERGSERAERAHGHRRGALHAQVSGRVSDDPARTGALIDKSGALWVRAERPAEASARLARALGRLAGQGLRTYPEDTEFLQDALSEQASPGIILSYIETLAWFLSNDPGERVARNAAAGASPDDGEQ